MALKRLKVFVIFKLVFSRQWVGKKIVPHFCDFLNKNLCEILDESEKASKVHGFLTHRNVWLQDLAIHRVD